MKKKQRAKNNRRNEFQQLYIFTKPKQCCKKRLDVRVTKGPDKDEKWNEFQQLLIFTKSTPSVAKRDWLLW